MSHGAYRLKAVEDVTMQIVWEASEAKDPLILKLPKGCQYTVQTELQLNTRDGFRPIIGKMYPREWYDALAQEAKETEA